LASGDVIAILALAGYNSAAFTAASARLRAVATQSGQQRTMETAIEMVYDGKQFHTLNTTAFSTGSKHECRHWDGPALRLLSELMQQKSWA